MAPSHASSCCADFVSKLLHGICTLVDLPLTTSACWWHFILHRYDDYVFLVGTVPKPTLKELLKVKVENWYNLGLVLDIDDNDLHKIESNRPQDQDGCMRDMFRAWLRMNPQASYSQLVQSLVELGDLTEADRLCRKYGEQYIIHHHLYL